MNQTWIFSWVALSLGPVWEVLTVSLLSCLALKEPCQMSQHLACKLTPDTYPFAITYLFFFFPYISCFPADRTSPLLCLNIPSTEILNFFCNTPFSYEYSNFPFFAFLKNFANLWFISQLTSTSLDTKNSKTTFAFRETEIHSNELWMKYNFMHFFATYNGHYARSFYIWQALKKW